MSIFDALLEIFIILGYMNKFLSTSSGSGGILKTDQKHRTQKAAEKANELYCYSCETMDINHNFCMNVSEKDTELHSKCDENKRICTVKRVSFLSSGENATMGHKTWSLSRSCSDRCQPGCIVIGERLKLRKCVTCCTENLCNFGNSASASLLSLNVPIVLPVALLLTKIRYKLLNCSLFRYGTKDGKCPKKRLRGDRNKIFVCWTCCETSFCNFGTGAASQNYLPFPTVPILIILNVLGHLINA